MVGIVSEIRPAGNIRKRRKPLYSLITHASLTDWRDEALNTMLTGFAESLKLIFGLDQEILKILLLSLRVSGIAVLISMLLGIPAGLFLSNSRFPGRKLLVAAVNTGMGLPPVLAGLVVYLILSRSGPLGHLNLIYTPCAIVIAQVIIACPVVAGLVMAALQGLDPTLRLQALGLGASKVQVWMLLLRECRFSALAAVMAAFGAIISEVGAVMIVGGDIKDQTRVMTTAIVLETRMGNYERAFALGIILLLVSFLVNYMLTMLQQKGRR